MIRALLLASFLAFGCGGPAVDPAPPAADADVAYWTCPMHPSVHAAGPGKCPICGMTLEPVTREDQRGGAVIVPEASRVTYGIETAPAEVREMRSTIRGLGTVTWSAAGLADVTAKVDGYVRDARVTERGAPVRKGEALLTLYSPELLVAQEDLLAAIRQRADDPAAAPRVEAARRRLRLWDVPDGQIDRIIAEGRASEALPIPSPVTGRVLEADVVDGRAVMRGERLYRLGDTSRLWIEASFPEDEAASLSPGQAARVSGAGGDRAGTVTVVLPGVEAETRTATVRIEVADPAGLVPDAWTRVEIDAGGGPQLAVPESAVLYTGPRRVVFVDEGHDRLAPRTVRTGVRSGGWIAIEDGLSAGDRVVVSGNFLVAADSRIRSGEGAW